MDTNEVRMRSKAIALSTLLLVLACERKEQIRILTAKEASKIVLEQCLKRVGSDFVESGKNRKFGMTLCAFEGSRIYVDGGYFSVDRDMMKEVLSQLRELNFPSAISTGTGGEDDVVSVCWGKNLKDWTQRYCRFVD